MPLTLTLVGLQGQPPSAHLRATAIQNVPFENITGPEEAIRSIL